MKRFSLWLQRGYIVAFLLVAWYIAPFTRFDPLFPLAWSLLVAVSAFVIPAQGTPDQEQPSGSRAVQALLVGLLLGLSLGAADWTVLDATLLFEFCWGLMPLFLYDRFFGWAWRKLRPSPS